MTQSAPTFELVVLSGRHSGHRRMLSQTRRMMIGRRPEQTVGEYDNLSFPVPRRYQFSLRWDQKRQQFLFINVSVLDITRINGEPIEHGDARPVGDGDIVEVEYRDCFISRDGQLEDQPACVRIGFSAVERDDS